MMFQIVAEVTCETVVLNSESEFSCAECACISIQKLFLALARLIFLSSILLELHKPSSFFCSTLEKTETEMSQGSKQTGRFIYI